MNRCSVLALGGLVRAVENWQAIAVTVTAKYSGARLQCSAVVVFPVLVGGVGRQAKEWIVADNLGRVRVWSDLGALIAKLRAALGFPDGALNVRVVFENIREAALSDMTEAAAKRRVVLDKLKVAASSDQSKRMSYMALMEQMTPWSAAEQARFNEMEERGVSVLEDMEEIDRQLARLPVVSLKPDY